MNKTFHILTMILISVSVFSQTNDTTLAGKYTDQIGDVIITELHLRKDGTFYLKTPDPVFSYTFQDFENQGIWIWRNDSVILNPELNQLKTKVTIKQNNTEETDSISLNVRYFVDNFQSDSLLMREENEFELMTIFINKKRKYFNLVRESRRNM